jgi:hypothetical protein
MLPALELVVTCLPYRWHLALLGWASDTHLWGPIFIWWLSG